MNGKTAELYDILVQEGVDLALSKEECETSEGLVHLLEDTEQTLAAVEKALSEEPKVIKGGSTNKQKRRRIKKLPNQLKKDYLPRKQRSLRIEKFLRNATPSLKQTMMLPLYE